MRFNASEMRCKSILKGIFKTLWMRWQTLANALNETATGRLESFTEPLLLELWSLYNELLTANIETLARTHATLARIYRFEFETKQNTWNFPVILKRTRLSQLSCGCCNLPFWLHFIHEIMAVKRLSATCVCFEWHSIWTIDRVSSFTEFKSTLPLWKTSHSGKSLKCLRLFTIKCNRQSWSFVTHIPSHAHHAFHNDLKDNYLSMKLYRTLGKRLCFSKFHSYLVFLMKYWWLLMVMNC